MIKKEILNFGRFKESLVIVDDMELKEDSYGYLSIEEQQLYLKRKTSFIQLIRAAAINDGIIKLDTNKQKEVADFFDQALKTLDLISFIPASGAASRMFQPLLVALEKNDLEQLASLASQFENFPFGKQLQAKDGTEKVNELLFEAGLNYANLPKLLLDFHTENGHATTPFESHIEENIALNTSDAAVSIHFTLSPNHENAFLEKLELLKSKFSANKLDITYSFQDKASDTISIDEDDLLLRDENGKIVKRPGGHGALVHNLNRINADLILIKNVDNIAHKDHRTNSLHHKKVLAGLAAMLKEQIDWYLVKFEEGILNKQDVIDFNAFIESYFHQNFSAEIEANWIKASQKLANLVDRPFRVCGMVPNTGEPGGGPFWIENKGAISLQIIEKAQINTEAADQVEILNKATHFNPVDIACMVKNHRGEKYDLHKYVDREAVFIAHKNYKGKPIYALELPGLWNGAMANWLTIFVEMPLETFNPVKVYTDLLKKGHQPKEV